MKQCGKDINGNDVEIEVDTENLIIPEGVAELPYCFCRDNKKIKSVSFPSTLLKIKASAFQKCKIETIDFKSGLVEICDSAFNDCTALKKIEFPGSIKYIGNAFANCKNLQEVVFNNSDIEIGHKAFENCKKLCTDDSIIMNNIFLSYIGNSKTVTVPEGVTYIAEYAFANNHNIVEIVLPDSLKKIGTCAFVACENLSKININPSVLIADDAFTNCEKLANDDGLIVFNDICYQYIGEDTDTIRFTEGIKVIERELFPLNKWDGSRNEIKSKIKTIVFPSTLKAIKKDAFSYCSAIEKLKMPESLETVGPFAFYGCKSLSEIDDNRKVTYESGALSRCDKLADKNGFITKNNIVFGYVGVESKVCIPDGIVEISGRAFEQKLLDESIIEEISLPDSVEKIDRAAFFNCQHLKKINIPERVTSIADKTFSECHSLQEIKLSENIETFGEEAFLNCYDLKIFNWPLKLKEIGTRAFKDCCSIENISFGKNIEYVADDAFAGMASVTKVEGDLSKVPVECLSCLSGLKDKNGFLIINKTLFDYFELSDCDEVNVPEGVEIIEDNAFDRKRIKSIELPKSLKKIGDKAFWNCEQLTEIKFNGPVEYIGNNTFYGNKRLKEIIFPETIKEIGDYAFKFCSELSEVKIPVSLKSIPNGLFESCKKLTCITIPKSVETIGNHFISGCTALKEIVTEGNNFVVEDGILYSNDKKSIYATVGIKDTEIVIKDGVENVLEDAFSNAINLKKVTFPSSIKKIDHFSFYKTFLEDIVIPEDAKDVDINNGAFDFRIWEKPYRSYPNLSVKWFNSPEIVNMLVLGYLENPELYSGTIKNDYIDYVKKHLKLVSKKVSANKLTNALKTLSEIDNSNPVSGSINNVNYKKLSDQAKVELVERTIVESDIKTLEDVINGVGDFEFKARALGFACLYGGLDKVKLLISKGATFKFDPTPLNCRRYKCIYKATYSSYPLDYSLMLLKTNKDTYLNSMSAYSYELHIGKHDLIKTKELSTKERTEILDYILKQKNDMGFNHSDALYYSIIWGNKEATEYLIANKFILADEYMTAASSSKPSMYRNEITDNLIGMDSETCYWALKTINELLKEKGMSFCLTQKLFDAKNTPFNSTEVLEYVINNMDFSKINKTSLEEECIDKNNIQSLEIMANNEWFSKKSQIDKLIEYAQNNKASEALVWLLNYKNKIVCAKGNFADIKNF